MKRKFYTILFMLVLLPVTLGSATETNGANMTYSPELLSVVVPSRVMFTINPFELNERGQVYSDEYWIENRGDTSVYLTFTDVAVIFVNDTDFEAVRDPFDTIESMRKSIYLALKFGRGDIPDIIFTDPTYEAGTVIELEPREILPFSFTGTVNENPGVNWNSGDVKVQLRYSLAYASQFDYGGDPDTSSYNDGFPAQNELENIGGEFEFTYRDEFTMQDEPEDISGAFRYHDEFTEQDKPEDGVIPVTEKTDTDNPQHETEGNEEDNG